MRKICVVLVSAFSILYISSMRALALEEGGKITLGILTLKPIDILDKEALTLTNRLYSELIRTQAYIVIEMSRVNEVLEELGITQTGLCSETECIVNVGKHLAAQWMVAGSVGRMGRTYTVETRLINVETRANIFSTTDEYAGEIEGLLKTMKIVAEKHAKFVKNVGDIQIISEPADATIFINEKLVGKTPKRAENIPPGVYEIKLQKDGFIQKSAKIKVEAGTLSSINLKLLKIYILGVNSKPDNAMVWINDKPISRTPLTRKVPEGLYQIKIELKNYPVWKSAVKVDRDSTIFVKFNPEKSTFSAGFKSLLFPGWGQFSNGKPLKGTLILLSEICAAVGASYFYLKSESTWDQMLRASTSDEITEKFDQSKNEYHNGQIFVWAGSAIWALGVLDAILDARKNNGSSSQNYSITKCYGLSLKLGQFKNKKVAIQWTKTF